MLEKIQAALIVSCQALEDEPLHSPFIMSRMALAAKRAGAKGIRAQGIADIHAIKKTVTLPVIGIIKKNYPDSDVYITPTLLEVKKLIETNCEMIALDATNRTRPHDEKIEDLLAYIQRHGIKAMADISTYEEALQAEKLGFDCVSTTLSGYTPYSKKTEGPNFDLIEKLIHQLKIPVIAEGKIHTPKQLSQAFDLGVHAVVVGGAITRPQEITARFVKAIKTK